MRRFVFWTVSSLALAGTVSAVVAVTTVRWLSRAPSAHAGTIAAPLLAAARRTAAPPPDAESQLAMDLIRRASEGDVDGAVALTFAMTPEQLRTAITDFAPVALSSGRLPAEDGRAQVLVWTEHVAGGAKGLSTYQFTLSEQKVTAVSGPQVPLQGYSRFGLHPMDEQGAPVDLNALRGKGVVLVSVRAPEPELGATLAAMQQALEPQGVLVVLAVDLRSPDWAPSAREAGFTGPIWKVKARLEDVPVVVPGRLLGAVGLLIDPLGYTVGSLALLDPGRYGVTDKGVLDVAPTVLKAYGVIPTSH